MKTTRKVFKTMIRLMTIAILVSIAQGCDAEIPSEDNIPPEFLFRISGAGAEYTFDQDFDFDNSYLMLKEGETYDITLSGGDGGGLKSIEWTFSPDCVSIDGTIAPRWTMRQENGREVVEWEGDRRNPFTGSILSVDMTTVGACTGSYSSFDFEVSDFGGEFGSSNVISKSLSIWHSRDRFLIRRRIGR